MLCRLTRDGYLSAEDVRAVLDTGVSRQQVEDALAICYAFNVTNRLANAFGFEVLSQEGFQAGAKYLLRRGYR
jgi:alkylhydroperoxidase family enzyme